MNKKKFVENVICHLKSKLAEACIAADNAHKAATDDQSVAETQYDTLAIESSYLAEGQSRRITEFQLAIQRYKDLPLTNFTDDDAIAIGAMVQISSNKIRQHWFFIGPNSGGFRTMIDDLNVTVITPYSPMGIALLGKYQGDDVYMKQGNNELKDMIIKVY
jgi:transcription elongation GreA/GreB family factor